VQASTGCHIFAPLHRLDNRDKVWPMTVGAVHLADGDVDMDGERMTAAKTNARRAKAVGARAENRLNPQRFARDEDGHVVVFTTVMLTLMLMMAGVGIDLMQFETVRTKQQQTLDRATLAAASLTQDLDAQTVVRDYFEKANMTAHLKSVETIRGFNSSTVRAEAEYEVTPTFMNLYDFSNDTRLIARGSSQAEQRISNIEIMLVLDVSGSMLGSKLTNLKTAASEFIDTVLDQDTENRVSIGIVPYNGQVNLHQNMQNLFTRVDDHGVNEVNCFDLPSSTYGTLSLSSTTGMPVTAHADTFTTQSSTGYVAPTDASALPVVTNQWCPPYSNPRGDGIASTNFLRAPTNDRNALKSHINQLVAVGATSINAGMKWGMALLDPSANSIYTGMVAAGQTPSYFSTRPFAYDDRDAMKIVVLMTDGEHFAEQRVNTGFRAGTSPIWRATTGGLYSVFQSNRVNTSSTTNLCNSRPFYVPHLNAWHSRPWNGATPSTSACYSTTATYTGATAQSWPQLWDDLRLTYVARQFYARPNGNTTSAYDNAMNMFRSQTTVATMNTQLQQVCGQARARDVLVYGIAFEAPTNGATQIAQCASSPAHFFDAQGLEIRTAFRSIATNITQLKLTQ
jgi:Flp pilus assembly protein TadG